MPSRFCEKTVAVVAQLEADLWIRILPAVLSGLPSLGGETGTLSPAWIQLFPGSNLSPFLVCCQFSWSCWCFAFTSVGSDRGRNPLFFFCHYFHPTPFPIFFYVFLFFILSSCLAWMLISLWQLPQPVWFIGFCNHLFFFIISKLSAFSLKTYILSLLLTVLICAFISNNFFSFWKIHVYHIH